MQKGKVYRSTGSWYDVKLDTGDFIKARIQGKFRNLSIKTTNPVSVGDEVDLLISRDEILFSVTFTMTNYTKPRYLLNLLNEENKLRAYWLR